MTASILRSPGSRHKLQKIIASCQVLALFSVFISGLEVWVNHSSLVSKPLFYLSLCEYMYLLILSGSHSHAPPTGKHFNVTTVCPFICVNSSKLCVTFLYAYMFNLHKLLCYKSTFAFYCSHSFCGFEVHPCHSLFF